MKIGIIGAGKIVIDAMNPYREGGGVYDLGESSSSDGSGSAGDFGSSRGTAPFRMTHPLATPLPMEAQWSR